MGVYFSNIIKMTKVEQNVPYTINMKPLSEKVVTLSLYPNRAERRRVKRLRSWFTRTPMFLKKANKIVKNTKQKNGIRKKINSLINSFSRQIWIA